MIAVKANRGGQCVRGVFAGLVTLLAGLASAASPPGRAVVHSMPAAGRSYELLIPPGKPEDLKRLPLVVYLHSSGDPKLDRARRDYWPMLAARKCLMAMPLGKSRKMWLSGEDKFIAEVIADVQTRYSVDAGRILLLGVSGGGQMALFLADHLPGRFRAVVVVSTNPVVVRGRRSEWFYPDRKTLKSCPYFVVNHITQGSALMYWRQVRARLAPAGASISILPVTGKVEHYLPPPKELPAWLDQVLAGKHPKPLPDPQAVAVAKMFRKCVAALPEAIRAAKPAPGREKIEKQGKRFVLSLTPPTDPRHNGGVPALEASFQRSGGEQDADSTGAPLTQIRIEHRKWPIYLRCEARATKKPMEAVLAAEEAKTAERGMLYQLYHSGRTAAAGRNWRIRIGSITYPDRRRGWVSALFIHAAAPIRANPKRWLTVMVTDETHQPDAKELARILKTALSTVSAQRAPKK